jgi:hypothetical protein
VLDEHVIFFEAAGIEQDGQALSRGQPALRVLRLDPLLAASEPSQFSPLFELFDGRRQPFSPLSRFLPRAAWPVNRADWRLLQCSNGEFLLIGAAVAEP